MRMTNAVPRLYRERGSRVLLALTMVTLVWCSTARAGEISFVYDHDGDHPGTVWITVTMDPIDWGPCDECQLPDWSEIHVSPAPLQPAPWTGSSYPGGSIEFDESGAFVDGFGYQRTLILDTATVYEVTAAVTLRQGLAVEVLIDGTRECQSEVGCVHEVTDYPALIIDPLTVPAAAESFSGIKSRY